MLTFDWPWMLLALPLPWLARRVLSPAPRPRPALLVPFYRDLGTAGPDLRPGAESRPVPLLILWLIWTLLLFSAARPLWQGPPTPVAPSGRNLMLAVDISGSMDTGDMAFDGQQITRLEAVKRVVGDFVERRRGDRLGLVLFGSRAYVQAPLTFDRRTLNQLLQEAQIGFAGERTAIGDALGLAIKRLVDQPPGDAVIILLTDGANTAGTVSALDAATIAGQRGIRVYTLGFGAESLVVRGLLGTRQINPSADLDEQTLATIAERTGGQYFRARGVNELAEVYATLDRLEPLAAESAVIRPQRSLFHWPLALALLIGLTACVLRDGILRRKTAEVQHG